MRVMITGGAGFIGANLTNHLELAGHEIVVFDDLSTGFERNLDGTAAELVVGSLLDPNAVQSATESADAIVHLGALPSVPRSIGDPVASHMVNATGTVNVLEAARHDGGLHAASLMLCLVYVRL